jgi:DinB superfamily
MMTAKDAIKYEMDMSLNVLKTYLSDLSDADLMVRPAKGANHLAWQLGHLIHSEADLVNGACPGAAAALPAGFAAAHSKESTGIDDRSKFLGKQQYLDLLDKQRAATKAAMDKLPDADMDKPGPESFRSFCPTVGSVFALIGGHILMHSGQFATVRRILGKPVLI